MDDYYTNTRYTYDYTKISQTRYEEEKATADQTEN